MRREVFDEAAKQFREDAECGALVRRILADYGSVSFNRAPRGAFVVCVIDRSSEDLSVIENHSTLNAAVAAAARA